MAGRPHGSSLADVRDVDRLRAIVERLRPPPFERGIVRRVRIVTAPDGGQLRTVLTGTKTVRSIGYPSRKFRCARYGEAETEDARILEEEVRVDVVDSIAQPWRVEVLVDDQWHVAFPDFVVLHSDGRRAVVECKRDWAAFRRRDAIRQAFLARTAAAVLGFDYEEYVLAHAGDRRRRENVDRVQGQRFLPVGDAEVARCAQALSTGPTSLRTLSMILHPDAVVGENMAFALMVRRVVEIDLSGVLGPRTECRGVPPTPRDLPSIRKKGVSK